MVIARPSAGCSGISQFWLAKDMNPLFGIQMLPLLLSDNA